MNREFDIRSFNYVTWNWKLDVEVDKVKEEIDYQITACNINAVTFAFAATQEHCYSTEMNWTGEHMPEQSELKEIVSYAKLRNLKVIIKPMVNVADGYWRAYIRFLDEDVHCEPKWSQWFKNYNEYLLNYAQFCEENNVDLLIIGCELIGTDHREGEWRNLINLIRKEYKGMLTYNCDKYQEHNVKWWDALDYISSSGYYPVTTISKELDRIREVSEKYNKPFIFTEAGCPSSKYSSTVPNDWYFISNKEESQEDQYEYFKELFEESSKYEFIKGFCLWDWPIGLIHRKNDYRKYDYSIVGKKSEALIKLVFSLEINNKKHANIIKH